MSVNLGVAFYIKIPVLKVLEILQENIFDLKEVLYLRRNERDL